MSPVVLSLCIAAVYAALALALRPPRFVEWPGYRLLAEDTALLRISLARHEEAKVRADLAAVRAEQDQLRRETSHLNRRIGVLTQERDDARNEAFAARRLAREDALAIVAEIRAEEEAEKGTAGHPAGTLKSTRR